MGNVSQKKYAMRNYSIAQGGGKIIVSAMVNITGDNEDGGRYRKYRSYPLISYEKSGDNADIDLDEVLSKAQSIREFLTFSCGYKIPVIQTTLITQKKNKKKNIRKEYVYILWDDIYRTKSEEKARTPLFTLQYYDNNTIDFFEKWFKLHKKYSNTIKMIAGVIYRDDMYMHLKFLMIVHALETWLRQRGGGYYLKKSEYKIKYDKLKIEINKIFTGDIEQALKNRNEWGNEYSLRKRIQNSAKKYKKEFWEVLGISDKKLYIAKIVDTRNYFTHWTKELEKKAYSDEELYVALQKLKVFCLAEVLLRIGVPSIDVAKRAKELSPEFYIPPG